MRLRPAGAPRPRGAPVAPCSDFAPLAEAAPLPWEVLDDPPAAPPGGRVRTDLSGEWRRAAPPEGDPSFPAPHRAGGERPPADARWRKVVVPENFGFDGELSCHHAPVWYRRTLRVAGDDVAPPVARLRFAAVDYLADVWVDGVHLGQHEGCFAPFGFDLSRHAGRDVDLLVRVQDPFEALDPEAFFFAHKKRVIKGTMSYHDSRPGGLPGRMSGPLAPGEPPYVWTPEWGQSMSTGGIVGPVTLERCADVELRAVFVTNLDSGGIQLAVVLVHHGEAAREVVLHLSIPGLAPAAVGVRVPAGAARVDAVLDAGGLERWYPAGDERGRPALHTVTVVAADRTTGAALDRASATFGVRDAAVVLDGEGHPRHLAVDGRPVMVKAVNYIPWQHFAEVDRAFYDRDMRMLAAAHANSVGVHAHVQSPHCYAASDAAGMLVFQDFPLQWFYDSGTATSPGFVEEACRQIVDMGLLLHNHPSVVYYACHNEPLRMFDPSTAGDGPETDRGEAHLDAALHRTLDGLATGRHVHEASGIGDDAHVYAGSLTGGTMERVGEQRAWFVSEYGFWTIGPQHAKFGDRGWPPDTAAMREWVSRLSFIGSTMSFAGTPERYASLAAWSEATEVYGAALCTYQTEYFRIRRGSPYGAYRWHFWADWWGYAGAGLVDVDRVPKATYAAFAAANRPLLVTVTRDRSVVEPGRHERTVVALNDRAEALDVEVEVATHESTSIVVAADPDGARIGLAYPADPGSAIAVPDRTGARLASSRYTARVAPASVQALGPIAVDLEPGTSRTLVLTWRDPVTGATEHNATHLHCPAPDAAYPPGLYRPGR